MSGADGVLVGEAIMGDGDVLALTIERGSEGGDGAPVRLVLGGSDEPLPGACVAAAAPLGLAAGRRGGRELIDRAILPTEISIAE